MAAKVDLPPPPLDIDVTGGGSGWVELVKARDEIDAHLLKGRLEETGIETMTVKDRSSPAWLYGGSNPWAPVTIMVRKLQLEDARIVLAEIALESPAEERPPAQRVGAPRRRRTGLVWWLIALLLGATVTSTVMMHALRGGPCPNSVICTSTGGTASP